METKTEKKRWYLSQSAIFTDRDYDIPAIQAIVKANGGENVRKAYQYGWSNQPKVVTWTSDLKVREEIKEALENKYPAFQNTIATPIIYGKDW